MIPVVALLAGIDEPVPALRRRGAPTAGSYARRPGPGAGETLPVQAAAEGALAIRCAGSRLLRPAHAVQARTGRTLRIRRAADVLAGARDAGSERTLRVIV